MKSYIVLIFFIVIMCPIILIAGAPGPTCPVYWDVPTGFPGPWGGIGYDTTSTIWMQNNCIAITKSQGLYADARDVDGEVCPDGYHWWVDDCDYKWYKDKKGANGNWGNLSVFDGVTVTYNADNTPTLSNQPYRFILLGRDHGKYGESSLDKSHYWPLDPPEPTSGWLFVGSIEPLNVVIPTDETNFLIPHELLTPSELAELQCSGDSPYGGGDFWTVIASHSSNVSFSNIAIYEDVEFFWTDCPDGGNPIINTQSSTLDAFNLYIDKLQECCHNQRAGCLVVFKQTMKIGPSKVPYITNQITFSFHNDGTISTDRRKWTL